MRYSIVGNSSTFLLLLCVCFASTFVRSEVINKDLLECIQEDKCGLFSVCSYSIIFNEPCVSGKNCSETSNGLNEMLIEGNVMLLKNGLDHIVDYTWNVVGYVHDAKTDDVSTRKYVLPSFSYAYFDTGIPLHHTVRLISNGETIDTKTSSKKECTMHEACQYLLRACQSSLVFINTNSMNPKINCMLYAQACNYFVHLPDLSSSSSSSPPPNDNNNENFYPDGSNGDARMDVYREGATTCVIDCLWSWYPGRWLPTRSTLSSFVDSLDIVRRIHLGISTDPKECKDIVFTDDKNDIFHTTVDDELMLMLNREGGHGRSGNVATIAWLSVFLVLVVFLFFLFAGYVYFVKYYKKQKSLFGGNSHKHRDYDDDNDTVL